MKTKATHKLSCMPTIVGILFIITTIIGMLLTSSIVSADVVDKVSITVPMSCTLEGIGMNTHNAEINNGQYNSAIGETTLKAFCNDTDGFAIYAIGYTDNLNGKNVLTNADLGSTHDIVTGTAVSGANSNWAMKLSTITSPTPTYPVTIQNSYDSFHNVPTNYELVASRNSSTDVGELAEGSTLKTTYQAYISSTQPAGTYTGQVKYILVHPNLISNTSYTITYNANTEDDITNLPDKQYGVTTDGTTTISPIKPEREGYGFYGWCSVPTNDDTCSGDLYRAKATYTIPVNDANNISLYAIWGTYAELDTGRNVNNKMKSLAAGATTAFSTPTYDIKAIKMASMLPNAFVATADNTISSDVSEYPVYIWYDNTNDDGILYVYTEADRVRLNADSRYLVLYHKLLTDISGLSDWDASQATDLTVAFRDTNLETLSSLSNWDTSNVQDMTGIFYHNPALTTLSGLENWDTSSVLTLYNAFSSNESLYSLSALANWDVSSLTSMLYAFSNNPSLTSLNGLEDWDTSNTVNMYAAFLEDVKIESLSPLLNWNTSNVENMADAFWGTMSITSFAGLELWDTSSVTSMSGMFGISNSTGRNDKTAFDLTPLKDWDVSNVTSMDYMFQNNNLASFKPLKDWDVSNVQNFRGMFNQTYTSTVTTLEGLEDWDVSSTTNVVGMFTDTPSLIDVSAINDWDIRNVQYTPGSTTAEDGNYFSHMFHGASVHPEFTMRAGAWNSEGTFIPSE